jgi:uncharacterized Zn-finger protein
MHARSASYTLRKTSFINSHVSCPKHSLQLNPLTLVYTTGHKYSGRILIKFFVLKMTLKRRYPCLFEGCGKTFSTSGHLSRHVKIHKGEKKHVCPIMGCESRFTRKDNMMQVFLVDVAFQFTQEENSQRTTQI